MKPDAINSPLRVGLISLGCAKNLVDAEIMLGSLLEEGVQVVSDATQADVVIVNTCSFIDAAQEESVDTILQSAQLRESAKPSQGLVVAGCLPQRFREQLPKLLPEVDVFMGIDQVREAGRIVRDAMVRRTERMQGTKGKSDNTNSVVESLAEIEKKGKLPPADGIRLRGTQRFGKTKIQVGAPTPQTPQVQVNARPIFIPDFGTPRFRLTPGHFAYVKIAEGCNHPCSFCIIPRMRGAHRSRAQSDVVAEARQLIADGVKELNLISQDTTFYGLDLRSERIGSIAAPERFRPAARANATTLATLLRELNAISGDFWIRLLYTHPAHWTDELIETIASCDKVVRYVDMPLQHIHGNMLERMRRETSEEYIRELIARLRAGIPGVALRTTFIVGFPGETERSFEALLDFIRETRFERLGVFTYSQEEGTRAGSMTGQVPDHTKQQRRSRAMAAQHEVAIGVSESFLGRTIRVLVEGEASARDLKKAKVLSWEHGLVREQDGHTAGLRGSFLVARGEADAPDIDGRVYVRGHLPIGRFTSVKVIGHTDYDLIAEPAGVRQSAKRKA